MAGSVLALRREGDSNPRSRGSRTTVFETAPFDRSGISPDLYTNSYPEFIAPEKDNLSEPQIWTNYFNYDLII